MSFFNTDHIRLALAYLPENTHPSLISFLAMLRNNVPVSPSPSAPFGGTQESGLLADYFAPKGGSPERPFYVPFGSPRANSTFWKPRDHGGSSLQRQRTGKSWVYKQGQGADSALWSLAPDLQSVLATRHREFVGARPISVHHLAAWCYRQADIADHAAAISRFIDEFRLQTYGLVGAAFTDEPDPALMAQPLMDRPVTDEQVFALLVPPPSAVNTDPDDIAAKVDGETPGPITDADPPTIPRQEVGLHFEINDEGILDFVSPAELDREGNNVRRLRSLHQPLIEMIAALVAALAKGNAPHAFLAERCRAYEAVIARDLETVDFARLYVEGVRLANAERAVSEQIQARELPPLDKEEREALESLLSLHGTFVMSSREGIESAAQERQYRMRPSEEREYRQAAVSFAGDLQGRPDIVAPGVASLVLGAAEQIGQGANPERSGSVGTSAVRNITIALSAGAAIAALPVISGLAFGPGGAIAGGAVALLTAEGLKKSKPFMALAAHLSSRFDRMSEADLARALESAVPPLRKHLAFILANEQRLRRLADDREAFVWLHAVLDWLGDRGRGTGP